MPATLEGVESQSFNAGIAAAVESVTFDVCDHSTAEELVISDTFIDGQDGSGVRSGDVVCGLVQMKLEEPHRKKNSSLNWEPQLPHSGKRNLEASFSYAESDGILQSKQIVQSSIEQSLMLRQSKVSTAEEILLRKCSTSESDCEVFHIQKGEFGDNKSVLLSRERDLELKFQKDGKNGCPFDSGENVVAEYLESSYFKQDNEREQSFDFEVKKAIGTNRNQLTMGVSGQEEIVQFRRKVSCNSPPNLLKESDDQRRLQLEYPELCKLLFGKRSVNRKEQWTNIEFGVSVIQDFVAQTNENVERGD